MKLLIFCAFFVLGKSLYCRPVHPYQILLIDTGRVKSSDTCDYKKIYHSNGKLKEEGCMKNGRKEGIWKEYNSASEYVRFVWTYKGGIKEGPYKVYYEDGILEAVGKYKYGTIDDSLKTFDKKGKLVELSIWEAESTGERSRCIKNESYDENRKPDGTLEFKNGKKYIWIEGKLEPF